MCECIKCTNIVVNTCLASSRPLSRKHPFASWLSSMMMCFAGAIVGNFLVGDSLIAPFKDNTVLIATAVWQVFKFSFENYINLMLNTNANKEYNY